ncbi:HNH endonuclease signature motif containing protein [Geodermatophilus ruber]|uniref:HNH nuclease domain-containing protein n=2 Tax=Geodermatophilus ruber TaxID=504800 RepID=A0A1I4IPK5_9ACTN|nr:HNH endonuclease signature motif containing protein [Geodermatophilus ruber]SFL55741.1 protein of unknown function [Geodermatophilus ruber]
MAGLTAALDGLAGEDLFGCGAPELLDRTRALVAARNRLDAELARTVRRGELAQAPEHDGLTTMASWLRGHARLSAAAARQLVHNGRALEQLPALAAAHAGGRVTADQVAVVEPITRPDKLALAAAQDVDLAGVDATLTEVATGRSHAGLAQVVHHYLQRLDQDGPEPDPTAGRTLRLAKHPDGSLTGRFDLDAVGGEKLQTALEPIVQAGRSASDERSRPQMLADALVQLCDNALAAGALPMLRTVKPHLIVRVDLADLAGPATGPAAAETGFGATISATRARWIACDAGITRIVLGPDGVPLDLGREHRLVSSHLRRAVEARDRGCVFAGCSAPTHWCDVHHLLEWINGGATSLENSALLCERHHTKVHHGFRLARQPDGRWRTWRPDGTEIRTGPADLRAA